MPKTTHPTPTEPNQIDRIRQLAKALKLSHIAATIEDACTRLDADPLSPEAFVQQLFAEEIRVRTERRIERLIRESKLPERKLLADCRVAPGGCPPGAPTDPAVRDYRSRLLGSWIRYRT